MAQNSGQSQKERESMTDDKQNESFDPSEHTADEVVQKLEEASEQERMKVAAAEQQGKGRKSVLEAAGVEGDVRMDASGRRLHPWEVEPPKREDA